MSHNGNSLRIDWFDGSVVEDRAPQRPSVPAATSLRNPPVTENKPIGFKRLLEISTMEPDQLVMEVSYRPGFWHLFQQTDLKGDFIVLLVKVLDKIFKTVQRERSNIKMVNQLETKFFDSPFLDKLKAYIDKLPAVRIVDKKMNMQLWDDVEGFFQSVVSLCEGIVEFQKKNNLFLKNVLYKFLQRVESSIYGVVAHHSERISDDIRSKISTCMFKILNINDKPLTKDSSGKDSFSSKGFRNLNIFPTKEDIFISTSNRPDANSIVDKIKVKPLIINGAYESVEHYLDIHFRLLREDYFGPLREGISKYLENPSNTKHDNIRVHEDVRILGTVVKGNKVGHMVDLAWNQRVKGEKINRQLYNKQLMYGSLLLFTKDKFETILCATVLDSDMQKLKKGYLTVSFQNPVSKEILYSLYLMIESEVFFEPYHQVLRVMQTSKWDSLPMQKYIVEVKPEVRPPAYLTQSTVYTITNNGTRVTVPVLNTNSWPKQIGFDQSQLEAYKFALTREFAVIQGPPGTGKTYLGLKIASALLENLSLEGSPLLVICFTNNALDQFLEGCLRITSQVIRVGGQSKSSKLEPYNLTNIRYKLGLKHRGFALVRNELAQLYEKMSTLQTEIEMCENGIVCYENLMDYLEVGGKRVELPPSKNDRVYDWLFQSLENNRLSHLTSQNYPVQSSTTIKECFSEEMALKQLDHINSTIEKLQESNLEVGKRPERIRKLQTESDKIRNRLSLFKKHMSAQKKTNQRRYNMYATVNDPYTLPEETRWKLYFSAVIKLKNNLLCRMDDLLKQHRVKTKELDDLSTQIDSEVIKRARVVGVTTSAAARRHDLMVKMSSNIVIIEEAAEVLEAHIIASLTPSLQHLILIGDHKQLRPSAANYQLAKECNLEVSLFERMISNAIHARTLTTQRRMRPNFARLLVPEVYTKLDSHESVYKYKDVKGMTKNLYFLTHEVFEGDDTSDDGCSHENSFEAEWCVAMSRYLLNQGYYSNDITVLTTYNGQVALINKLCLNYPELAELKITTVDNFQGEESRIVILSLVRSNKKGNIGFLTAQNRMCVALSRAKEGFYIIGNMKQLSKASSVWAAINKKLLDENAIGPTLCTDRPVSTALELHELC